MSSQITNQNSKKYDVFFIGAINYDIYVPHRNNEEETSSIAEDIKIEIGGGASITAMALSTLGLKTAVAGPVGKNPEIILNKLKEKNITSYFKQYNEVETAITIADHYPNGKRRYRADTRSNRLFSQNDLEEIVSEIIQSKIIMRTGYPWMLQIAGKPTAALFRYARSYNITTTLDMSNPDAWENSLLEELISEVIPTIDWLCANEKELYKLAKKSDEQIENSKIESYMTPERALEYACRLLNKGVKLVNLHYGSRGTMLITKDNYIIQEPPTIEKFVNPTGCGNLQNAGLIYCLLNNMDLNYAAKFSNAMAGLRLNGIDFPTLEDVKNLMVVK